MESAQTLIWALPPAVCCKGLRIPAMPSHDDHDPHANDRRRHCNARSRGRWRAVGASRVGAQIFCRMAASCILHTTTLRSNLGVPSRAADAQLRSDGAPVTTAAAVVATLKVVISSSWVLAPTARSRAIDLCARRFSCALRFEGSTQALYWMNAARTSRVGCGRVLHALVCLALNRQLSCHRYGSPWFHHVA